MKKSTIWSIIVVAVLALGGAGVFFYSSQQKQSQEQTANSSYSSHMQAGKEAVKAKKYSQAADEFDQAYQAKATAQAKNYQAQAENLADSIKLAKTTVKYASALNLAQKAQEQNGGYSVMTSQAKKLVKQLKAVKDNYDSEIKPLLNKAAKAMEDGDYDSAVSTYSSILDLPYINGAYYAKVRSNVKDLLKEAKSKLRALIGTDHDIAVLVPDPCICLRHETTSSPVSPGVVRRIDPGEEDLTIGSLLEESSGLDVTIECAHHSRINIILLEDLCIVEKKLRTYGILETIDLSIDDCIINRSVEVEVCLRLIVIGLVKEKACLSKLNKTYSIEHDDIGKRLLIPCHRVHDDSLLSISHCRNSLDVERHICCCIALSIEELLVERCSELRLSCRPDEKLSFRIDTICSCFIRRTACEYRHERNKADQCKHQNSLHKLNE